MNYVFGMFECLALVLVCLGLLGIRWRAARILLAAVLLCTIVAIIRSLPLPVGTNTVLSILTLALLISWLFSISFARSLIGAGCALVLLLLFETPMYFVIYALIEDPTTHPYVWLLASVPHVSLLYVIAFVLRSKNWKIFG